MIRCGKAYGASFYANPETFPDAVSQLLYRSTGYQPALPRRVRYLAQRCWWFAGYQLMNDLL